MATRTKSPVLSNGTAETPTPTSKDGSMSVVDGDRHERRRLVDGRVVSGKQ